MISSESSARPLDLGGGGGRRCVVGKPTENKKEGGEKKKNILFFGGEAPRSSFIYLSKKSAISRICVIYLY